MFPLMINDDLELRILEPGHADELFDLISRNREHLDNWLRWSGRVRTREDALASIERFVTKFEASDGFHAGMWYQGQLAGGLVCHTINRESNNTELGYWLGAEFTGKGLVTLACKAVIHHLFEREKLHRIEIQCATNNQRSRAVAERLGFTFEGVKRDSEWITSSYRDHAVYSLLDYEW